MVASGVSPWGGVEKYTDIFKPPQGATQPRQYTGIDSNSRSISERVSRFLYRLPAAGRPPCGGFFPCFPYLSTTGLRRVAMIVSSPAGIFFDNYFISAKCYHVFMAVQIMSRNFKRVFLRVLCVSVVNLLQMGE